MPQIAVNSKLSAYRQDKLKNLLNFMKQHETDSSGLPLRNGRQSTMFTEI